MMCVKPINVVNPRYRKYLADDKRFPNLPALDDFFLIVPCGKCFECRKKRASQWRSRLMLEVLHGKYKTAHFITFTFSDEYLKQFRLDDVYNIKRSDIAVPIRRFLERYRKYFGVSLRHFFVTELGDKKGRFHLHGIVFDSELKTKEQYDKVWKYGWTWIGYVNVKTVNYIVKYVTKTSPVNPDFVSDIFVSGGIGLPVVCCTNVLRDSSRASDQLGFFVISVGGKFFSCPRYLVEKIYRRSRIEQFKKRAREKIVNFPLQKHKIVVNSSQELRDVRSDLLRQSCNLHKTFDNQIKTNSILLKIDNSENFIAI